MRLQKRTIPLTKLKLPKPDQYFINEIFFSIQGEGRQAGTPMVFIRFSECNLRCTLVNAGFDCDTDFTSARPMSLASLLSEIASLNPARGWVLLTGGEPALQVNDDLIQSLHAANWKIAIETNGTIKLPKGIDWITVSPKSAEHTIRQKEANELKYVRKLGMSLPVPTVKAKYHFISPAFEANGTLKKETLDWCQTLVMQSPSTWSLTIQSHKLLGLR